MKERAVVTVFFFSAIAIGVGVFFPDRRETIALSWVLAMLAYGLIELNARSRLLVRERSRFDQILEDQPRETLIPDDLRRLERGLGWMSYEPSYFDFRVRPILRELIQHRVRENLGIDLETDPDAARDKLDRELLALLSTRKAESIYGYGNIYTHDIARMVTRIEAL